MQGWTAVGPNGNAAPEINGSSRGAAGRSESNRSVGVSSFDAGPPRPKPAGAFELTPELLLYGGRFRDG